MDEKAWSIPWRFTTGVLSQSIHKVNHITSKVCEVPGAPCHGDQDRARVQP